MLGLRYRILTILSLFIDLPIIAIAIVVALFRDSGEFNSLFEIIFKSGKSDNYTERIKKAKDQSKKIIKEIIQIMKQRDEERQLFISQSGYLAGVS